MHTYGNTPKELLDSFLTLPHETEWLEFNDANRPRFYRPPTG
jgi:hypothetical protein